MNVNKQFENWWETERLSTAFDSFREVAREAFLAGYAARKKQVDDRETAWAMDALENSLKPTMSTPRTPINEVDY